MSTKIVNSREGRTKLFKIIGRVRFGGTFQASCRMFDRLLWNKCMGHYKTRPNDVIADEG